jgi:hypothetical protein
MPYRDTGADLLSDDKVAARTARADKSRLNNGEQRPRACKVAGVSVNAMARLAAATPGER